MLKPYDPDVDAFEELESENAQLKKDLAGAVEERDRYIARCKKLEAERDAMREILK